MKQTSGLLKKKESSARKSGTFFVFKGKPIVFFFVFAAIVVRTTIRSTKLKKIPYKCVLRQFLASWRQSFRGIATGKNGVSDNKKRPGDNRKPDVKKRYWPPLPNKHNKDPSPLNIPIQDRVPNDSIARSHRTQPAQAPIRPIFFSCDLLSAILPEADLSRAREPVLRGTRL